MSAALLKLGRLCFRNSNTEHCSTDVHCWCIILLSCSAMCLL